MALPYKMTHGILLFYSHAFIAHKRIKKSCVVYLSGWHSFKCAFQNIQHKNIIDDDNNTSNSIEATRSIRYFFLYSLSLSHTLRKSWMKFNPFGEEQTEAAKAECAKPDFVSTSLLIFAFSICRSSSLECEKQKKKEEKLRIRFVLSVTTTGLLLFKIQRMKRLKEWESEREKKGWFHWLLFQFFFLFRNLILLHTKHVSFYSIVFAMSFALAVFFSIHFSTPHTNTLEM